MIILNLNLAEFQPQTTRTGVYDRIICKYCEDLFSPWDNYAATLLIHSTPDQIHNTENKITTYTFRAVDYEKIKLFFISLLWRVHTSNHEVFRDFILPDSVVEELASLIKSKTAPTAENFSVFLGKSDDECLSQIIYNPKIEKNNKAELAKIYIPGYVAHIMINSADIPSELFLYLLHPSSSWSAYHHDYIVNGEIYLAASAAGIDKKDLANLIKIIAYAANQKKL